MSTADLLARARNATIRDEECAAVKADAMAAAAALDREAAELAAQSRAKLAEASALRAPHCNWLERQAHAASAELACWDPSKLAAFREHFEANQERADVEA
ncbi:hypothetical protein ABNQ39_20955 [Azospirillum sp. A26]|uniref:hypothetical protein n=1 Tax=Azospirillum sp. A26 TaxID=3160607 RepID=UPI00366ED537